MIHPSVRWLKALPVLCLTAFVVSPPKTLYMPREVKMAYARGTRSLDGKPGPKYWENHAQYTITLTVMPPDRRIAGTETIVYHNNSPDTLRMLVFKLFPNYHKPGAPRLGGTTKNFLTSGIHIDAFSVNGRPDQSRPGPRTYTTWRVRMSSALAPRDSVKLSFGWHYKVSKRAGREGMIDSTTYYIAYFYPRVAVYDDYNGWDMLDHTGHEFYSDFNDYDVTVNVPDNFVVWGTGTLTDAADVLQPAAYRRFRASMRSDSTIHVGTYAQMVGDAITAHRAMNSWHFTSHDMPDVAFGVSDHYDWDAASVLVDPATHRRAGVQAAYADSSADYHYMVQFGRDALGWFSRNWPGVPYPYPKSTVFNGTADMEYPMMVNDGSTHDTAFSRMVVEHEMSHTYFPFYMGVNETRYGFMDEGWATTFEYLISLQKMGVAKENAFYKRFRVARWIHDSTPLSDLPIVTPEDMLNGAAYGDNAYGKASLGYLAVKDLLGDATFRKCLHAYMARWHGKHPTPWDFFYTFDDVSGKNLNWFWRDWFFSHNYIDLAIAKVTRRGGAYAVTVDNVGGMDAPFNVFMRYADGTADSVHETPAVWEADQQRTTVTVHPKQGLRSLRIDGGIFMDADTTNNSWAPGAR